MDERVFTQGERNFIGSVYLGLSIVILPIHSLILVVSFAEMSSNGGVWFQLFILHDDYRKQVAYRIMLSIGIADCLQQVSHIYTGLITLTSSNFNDSLEKVFLPNL